MEMLFSRTKNEMNRMITFQQTSKALMAIVLILLGIGGGSHTIYGQTETKFIMPTQVPIYYNPSFAGSLSNGRVAVTYRTQWVGIPGAPKVGYASWDQIVPKLLGGVGGAIHMGGVGPIRWGTAGMVWSPKFQVGSMFTLAPSVGVDLTASHFVVDSLRFTSPQPDPAVPDKSKTIWYPDVHAGFLINARSFYAGASVKHLLRPTLRFSPDPAITSRIKPALFVQAGYTFKTDPNSDWSISVNGIGYYQRPSGVIQGMLSGKFKSFIAGVGMDTTNDLLFMGGYKNDLFKVTYGYGHSTAINQFDLAGTHEISFLYYIPLDRR